MNCGGLYRAGGRKRGSKRSSRTKCNTLGEAQTSPSGIKNPGQRTFELKQGVFQRLQIEYMKEQRVKVEKWIGLWISNDEHNKGIFGRCGFAEGGTRLSVYGGKHNWRAVFNDIKLEDENIDGKGIYQKTSYYSHGFLNLGIKYGNSLLSKITLFDP